MAACSAGLHTHTLLVAFAFALDAGQVTAIMLNGDQYSNNVSIYLADPCTEADFHSKDLDLILYGATGFVGKLATEYLSNGHPDNPRWALAARDSVKLNSLFYKTHTNSESAASGTIIADLNDVQKLYTMARRAKVILSFAGPYETTGGEELVRAAIASCAHYVDVAGEINWKEYILKKYGTSAKQRGVAIVQSAGFYNMAADMMAMSAARELGKKGIIPGEVMVVWTKLNGHFTGGQMAELKWALGKYGPIHDPYILAPGITSKRDIEPSGFSKNIRLGKVYGWDARLGIMLLPFKNSDADCVVIRRSLQKTFNGADIAVREAKNTSVDSYHRIFRFPSHGYPIQPTPGSGPDSKLRDAGSALGFAIASASESDDPGAMVIMELSGDPATIATPRMAVEVAVSLAKRGPPNGEGGYLTPATSTSDIIDLENRLQRIDNGRFIKFTHPEVIRFSGVHR